MSIQRLENETDILAVRNAADNDYAPLKAKSLYLTDGTPDIGDVGSHLVGVQSNQGSDTFAFFGDELVYTAGTPIFAISSTLPYNFITFTSTNLANCKTTLFLRKGTWTFKFLTIKRNDMARLSVALDGFTIVAALELYAAVADLKFIHTLTGVIVGDTERKVIDFQADGHHASSSSYVMLINKVWGYRTGD